MTAALAYPQTTGDRTTQLLTRIRRLEQERDAALDQVAGLQAMLRPVDDNVARLGTLGLSPCQARIVQALHDGMILTRRQLHRAVYADDPRRFEEVDDHIVNVHLCRIRKLLGQHGIAIKTVGWHGYQMLRENKLRLRALIAGVA